MKRSALAIAIATVLTGSVALAQQTSTPQPSTYRPLTSQPSTTEQGETGTPVGDSRADYSNRDNADRTTTAPSASGATNASTNRSDEKFLKDFAQANATEVATGKMATDKAQNAEVKAFAKHMVAAHSKTIDKVEAIASKANVDVTEKPDMMHKNKSALFDNKEGAAFDEAYMKTMVDAHEKVVAMLQKEIREGQDASVKQLASQALPDVKKHLKMAQDLHAKLDTDKNISKSSSRTDSSSSSLNKVAADR